jgi:pimeloyl-ACP methyl ester carboxylesterase
MLLRTLGGLKLEDTTFTRPKPLLLLAYLALEGPRERRFLSELFWLGATDPLNRLSTALARLRKAAPGLIDADEARVWTETRTDAQELLSAVEAGEDEKALSLYKGPFLEGVYLSDWGEELEEWVYGTREFIAAQVRRARLTLASTRAAAGRFNDAAKQAEAAYRVAGAPPPEPEDVLKLYTLMLAGNNPYAAIVREEAAGFDLDIALTPEEAKARLQTELVATPWPRTATFTSRKMEQQIRFCTSPDGVRIAYATVGEGPALVKAANWLSHLDFDWNSPVWRHWFAALSKHHALIRYDQRGCGLSDWDALDLSVEAMVGDLEAVVDALGLHRFPLLGISGGGAVAAAYAVKHPEKVSHLILYGAFAAGQKKRNCSPEEEERAATLLNLMRLGWGAGNPAFRQFFTSLFMPEATLEQMHWFNDLQRVSTTTEMAVRLWQEYEERDVRELLPQVRVPTLVLHPNEDAIVPFGEGRELASLIPKARFVPLGSNNHILLEHEPAWQRFLTELYGFIGVGVAEESTSGFPGRLGKEAR